VPVSDKDKALIELAIGTVDEILELLPATSSPVTVTPAMYGAGVRAMRVGMPVHRAHVRRRLVRPIWNAKDFKKQWNALVAKDKGLAQVKVK